MRVMLLYKAKENVPLQVMWNALGKNCHIDKVPIGHYEFKNFNTFLRSLSFCDYDRILVDQTIGRLGSRYRSLRMIPNLVLRDQDACQNFIPSSPLHMRLATVYKDIANVRVIVPNKTCEQYFQGLGIDCKYLPKAVDPNRIYTTGCVRDIKYGFIGRIKHDAYRERRKFLETLSRRVKLSVLRTSVGDDEEYNSVLNRIRFFISADIGFNEYMYKNFEAMCAGCVLVAKRQPNIEQKALGFIDMENIVLYDDVGECIDKLTILDKDNDLADRIAVNGRSLVINYHTLEQRGNTLFDLLVPSIHPAKMPGWWEKVYRLKLSRWPL